MPITNPTAGAVHIDQALTNFALKIVQDQSKFVSMQAWPNRPVSKQSDKYHKFDLESWLKAQATQRADGDPAPRGGFTLSQDTFFCDVYAFAKPITDRQRANEDDAINLERSATQFVTQQLLMRREILMQQALFAPNLWYNGGTSASAGAAANWSNANSAADPIGQIKTAARAIESQTGLTPNRLLMGREAYDTLIVAENIVDLISGGATSANPALASRELLARALEVEQVHVMTSITQTGAASTRGYIGGDNVLLYYAPSGDIGTEDTSAGVSFSWNAPFGAAGGVADNGLFIKQFRDENTSSDIIEGNMSFDFKLTAPELGYLFIDVSEA